MPVEVSLQLNPVLYHSQHHAPSPHSAAVVTAITEQDWQHWFSQWFDLLQPNLSPINAYTLSLSLTDDQDIHQLNSTYRAVNQPTDVLAFAARETLIPSAIWQTMPMELGDIIISVETALRQAHPHGHTPQQELVWLASHGLLHLLGWDHPTPATLEKMLAQQDRLLRFIGCT